MLLPFRWLFYQLTGSTPPAERPLVGGKKRKLRLRKTPPRIAQWSEAVAPAFTPAIVADVTGVTANPAIGFIRTSIGNRVIGIDAVPVMLGMVTPRIGTRVSSVKAHVRVGSAAVKAEIALFDYEIAALMLS